MTAVNLLNWRHRRWKRQLKQWLWLSVTLLMLLSVALLLWRQGLTEEIRRRQSRLSLWQQATERAQQLTRRYEEAQKQQQILHQQAAQHQQKRQRLAQWQAFILQLESDVPDDIWLSSLAWRQQTLRLDGLSLRPDAARLLHQRLRVSGLFQSRLAVALQKSAEGPYRFTLATGKTEGVGDEK